MAHRDGPPADQRGAFLCQRHRGQDEAAQRESGAPAVYHFLFGSPHAPGGHASCLQGFQQEITLNTNKIDALIVFGENLIQKSAPLDAALIEDELEELHSYCQEVFGRVARFHQRLVNRRPVSPAHTDRSLINTCNLITKHKTFIELSVCFWNGRFWRRSRNCRIWKSRLV